VLTSRLAAGVLAILLAATVLAVDQQRNGQRPPQPQAAADQKAARGGPPPGGPRGSKWWQDEKMKAELRLSAEQSARIEEIFTAWLAKVKDKYDELSRREEQLSNLISGNDVTEAQLLKEADQVETLRSSLSKDRTLMLFRMRRVLSAEQRSKLVEIQKAQAQERERRGGRVPEHGQSGQ
jgi:Spy/CpxP family protein refolding chaperone